MGNARPAGHEKIRREGSSNCRLLGGKAQDEWCWGGQKAGAGLETRTTAGQETGATLRNTRWAISLVQSGIEKRYGGMNFAPQMRFSPGVGLWETGADR